MLHRIDVLLAERVDPGLVGPEEDVDLLLQLFAEIEGDHQPIFQFVIVDLIHDPHGILVLLHIFHCYFFLDDLLDEPTFEDFLVGMVEEPCEVPLAGGSQQFLLFLYHDGLFVFLVDQVRYFFGPLFPEV